MYEIPGGVRCPVCWKVVPETHVNAESMLATCPVCSVQLALSGYVEPQRPHPDYPDAAIADRDAQAKPSDFKVQQDGPTTTMKFGGIVFGLGATTLKITPDTITAKGSVLVGTPGSPVLRDAPLAMATSDVRGFAPVCVVTWVLRDGNRQFAARVSWQVRLVGLTEVGRVLPCDKGAFAVFESFYDFARARAFATLANQALQRARA